MWLRLTLSCAGLNRDSVLAAVAAQSWSAHAIESFGVENGTIVPGLILTVHDNVPSVAELWAVVRGAAPECCVCAFLETSSEREEGRCVLNALHANAHASL